MAAGSVGGGICGLLVALFVLAIVFTIQSTGYEPSVGYVTSSRWVYVKGRKSGHYEAEIHYRHGAKNVTKTVNVDNSIAYVFDGGSNCRAKQTATTRDRVKKIVASHPYGQTDTIYFKPKDHVYCLSKDQLTTNYYLAIAFWVCLGFLVCSPFLLLLFVSIFNDDHLADHVKFGCIVCVGVLFSPILVPLYLLYLLGARLAHCCGAIEEDHHAVSEFNEFNARVARNSTKVSEQLPSLPSIGWRSSGDATSRYESVANPTNDVEIQMSTHYAPQQQQQQQHQYQQLQVEQLEGRQQSLHHPDQPQPQPQQGPNPQPYYQQEVPSAPPLHLLSSAQ